jgi:hypothetical protein
MGARHEGQDGDCCIHSWTHPAWNTCLHGSCFPPSDMGSWQITHISSSAPSRVSALTVLPHTQRVMPATLTPPLAGCLSQTARRQVADQSVTTQPAHGYCESRSREARRNFRSAQPCARSPARALRPSTKSTRSCGGGSNGGGGVATKTTSVCDPQRQYHERLPSKTAVLWVLGVPASGGDAHAECRWWSQQKGWGHHSR